MLCGPRPQTINLRKWISSETGWQYGNNVVVVGRAVDLVCLQPLHGSIVIVLAGVAIDDVSILSDDLDEGEGTGWRREA